MASAVPSGKRKQFKENKRKPTSLATLFFNISDDGL